MVSNDRNAKVTHKKIGVKKVKKAKPKISKSLQKAKKDVKSVVPLDILAGINVTEPPEKILKEAIIDEEFEEKYPILKDKGLVAKFLSVSLSNNQKGRIRQILKDQLKGASDVVLPDVIYSKMINIIRDPENLSESDLRKLRILYNMLRTAVKTGKCVEKKKKKKQKKHKDKEKPTEISKDFFQQKKEKVDLAARKLKYAKRYVVFVGNLPPKIERDKIIDHFKDLSKDIVSVRIPKLEEGRKSSIAYVELASEISYEMALTKHHSMMGPKRINVLYTMQKNSTMPKSEAKCKSAKLIALHKAGKLTGSVPMLRKRSHRRAKAKAAKKAAENQGQSA